MNTEHGNREGNREGEYSCGKQDTPELITEAKKMREK